LLRIREYLSRTRIPHEWLDPDTDPGVEALLRESGVAPAELPVVIATGTVLRRPTLEALAAAPLTVHNHTHNEGTRQWTGPMR
jgi:thioredoxin reductase (NADPH)